MTIRGVSGQPDPGWISQYQPKAPDAKPTASQNQNQEPAYPPYDGPKLGKKPNLDDDGKNLEYWSDLRGSNLNRHKLSEQFQNMDLSKLRDVLMTCTFDSKTPWPPKEKLPPNFDPDKIMEMGKDPGLGIRDLHKQGITGKGVKVAIIDQPLFGGHNEYKDKLIRYTQVGYTDEDIKNGLVEKTSMHGPAVSSILAGDSCGVAPWASLYYWAVAPRAAETRQEIVDNYIADIIKAIWQIIKYNEENLKDPIKIISISRAFESNDKNRAEWYRVKKAAKAQGIIIITPDDVGGARCPYYKDRDNPNNYKKCYDGCSNKLYVPTDNRTYADFEEAGKYVTQGDGSLSWGVPYLAGVMALGLQVDPTLDEDTIYKYLRETGTPFIKKVDGKECNLGWIINPKGFVDRVKIEKENRDKKTK